MENVVRARCQINRNQTQKIYHFKASKKEDLKQKIVTPHLDPHLLACGFTVMITK